MDTTQTTPAPRPSVDALVFDAYGTLFDVQALTAQCEADWPGQGAAVSALWRGTQLEYSWLRSLMGRYADFERVTADALAHACATLALPLSSTQTARLVDAYRRLPVFAEVPAALAALGARPGGPGRPCAILSNGTPAMLAAVVDHAGLSTAFSAILSVDALRIYKPSPRVYRHAAERLGLPPERLGFVSANGWDISGAQACGLQTFWINRRHVPPERLGAAPDHTLASLEELAGLLA